MVFNEIPFTIKKQKKWTISCFGPFELHLSMGGKFLFRLRRP